MKKVLILVYYWPPSGGSGVQRWLKFCKYLADFGWQPIIVTPRHGTAPYYDDTLLHDVRPDTIVYKTGTLEPFALYNLLQFKKRRASIPVGMMGIKDSGRLYHRISNWIRANLFVPDARKGWVPFAIRGATKALAEHKIDAIITTGPPHSTHLAGLYLKNKYRIPWLADLRDPWTNIYYNKSLPRTAATKAKDYAYESNVLRKADAVTVVSQGMANEFKDRARNIHVVFNGFDEGDIPPIYTQATEKFTICHVGNFFPYMNVPTLWKVIRSCCESIPLFEQNFEINFTGLLDPIVKQQLVDAGLGKYLSTPGVVDHQKATMIMSQANLLLFVIPNIENNELVVTGKIFEYLACRSEILPIGNVKGNVAVILQQCGANPMIDYEDAQGQKAIIERSFTNWIGNDRKSPKSQNEQYKQYSRKAMTLKIVDILNQITPN